MPHRAPSALRAALLLTFLVLLAAPASAQDTPPETAAPSDSSAAPFFKPGGVWLRAGFGSFQANDDPQLPGQRGHTTGGLSVGAELTGAPFLSLEFELVTTQRKYDTAGGAFIIVVDDETSVTSTLLSLGARVHLPVSAPVRVYASGGLAYVHTRFKTDASLFGIPGVAKEQTDGGVQPVYGAGAQVIFGKWEIHADYRRFALTGSFPEYQVDEVDLGGSMILVGAGWRGF